MYTQYWQVGLDIQMEAIRALAVCQTALWLATAVLVASNLTLWGCAGGYFTTARCG